MKCKNRLNSPDTDRIWGGQIVRTARRDIQDDDLYYSGSSVEVIVRFRGKDRAVFVTMDDGKCIALDKDEEKRKLITDNYGLLKKLAKSVEYQYILNMNYTRFTFSEN